MSWRNDIRLHVLTSRSPRNCQRDKTMPYLFLGRVFRFGRKLPAILWGLLALIPCIKHRKKYDLFIFTSPPESLILTAWVMQRLGSKVLLDMRDSISRETQPHKRLIRLWEWFYKKINHVVVCAKIINDSGRIPDVVYHGYDEGVQRDPRALDPPVYYSSRVDYETYMLLLRHGFIRSFKDKVVGYGASSLHTIARLGYGADIDIAPDEYGLHSWQESEAKLYKIIKEIL